MAEAAEAFGGIDVAEAFRILHMDKRWNNCSMTSYVYPGCGYGGYCLPKDTCAFYTQAEAKGFDAQILGQVIRINMERPRQIAEQIGRYLMGEEEWIFLELIYDLLVYGSCNCGQ